MTLNPSEITNLDEMLRYAVKAVIEQGRPSIYPETTYQAVVCMYRGPGGVKCAVGHLIPDANYKNRMEGQPVYGSDVANALIRVYPWMLEYSARMLEGPLATLQSCHDGAGTTTSSPDAFVRLFKKRVRDSIDIKALPASLADLVKED